MLCVCLIVQLMPSHRKNRSYSEDNGGEAVSGSQVHQAAVGKGTYHF